MTNLKGLKVGMEIEYYSKDIHKWIRAKVVGLTTMKVRVDISYEKGKLVDPSSLRMKNWQESVVQDGLVP